MQGDANGMRIDTFGDFGRAIAGLDQHVAALGTQRRGNSLGQCLDSRQQSSSAFNAELELLVGKSLLDQRSRSYSRLASDGSRCGREDALHGDDLGRDQWMQSR